MGTILASSSQAAAATTTTAAFAFDANDTVMTGCTIGASPPNSQCQCTLQLSLNGTTWFNADTRTYGVEPNNTYWQTFNLSDYVGALVGGSPNAIALANSATPWQQFRLFFSGNDTQAVTIVAIDSDVLEMATIALTATTATTGGALGTWQPPGGASVVIIDRAIVYVATASTGAANITVGQGSSATTSYTNLIPATSVHTSGSVIDSYTTQIIAATAAESGIADLAVIVPAGNYVTFTGSASTAGMVATAYLRYLKP